MKINNIPWTIEDARAARELAREFVRQSRILIQNSNALLDQEQRADEITPSQFRQQDHALDRDACFD